MHVRRSFISIIFVLAMVVVAIFGDNYERFTLIDTESIYTDTDTITIWFTDSVMEEYVRNAAVVYEEETGVRVVPTYVSGLEFLEAIQEATIDEDYGPDLYIIGSESLEKAYLSGLCSEVSDSSMVLNSTYYPQTALNAITYNNKKLGYPLSFEGSVFLYNRTILEQVAEKYNESIANGEVTTNYGEGSVDEEAGSEETQTIEAKTADDILPTSIVGIIEFALKYNLSDGVDSYFKWCVSDVLYEYWFAGAYLNVGGKNGDNRDEIDIYNSDSIYCMKVFQDFKQFFSMEIDETSYPEVLQEFEDGKLLFMVADTDVVNELENAKKEGNFDYEYGITSIGMLNDTLKSKGLSVTKLVAVNGLSDKKVVAEDFAKFLSVDYSDNFYSRTGKYACAYQEEYAYPQMEDVVRTYENSVSLPKIVETSNYWVLTEMVYTKAWDGGNANRLLRELSGQVKKQIYGVYVEDAEIEDPQIDEDYVSKD